MARTGGVLTFCMIAAAVLGVLLSIVARHSPILGIVALLLFLAAFVMWFVVMVALKVDLAQNGYDRAGGLIIAIIVLTAVMIIVGIVAAFVVGSQFAGMSQTSQVDPAQVMRAFGIWAIILGVLTLVYTICFLLLGARLSDYGSTAGGAWKGAGVVLIIACALGLLNWVLYAITALAHVGALAFVVGIIGLIGLILWLVVWILIGVGFMGDANRAAAARA